MNCARVVELAVKTRPHHRYTCVPQSERKAFDFSLRVAEAFESLDACEIGGLPVTRDAGRWFPSRLARVPSTALPRNIRGEIPETSDVRDMDRTEAICMANQLTEIRQATDALPRRP